MLTSNGKDLIDLILVLHTVCHEAGQICLADGLAAGQVPIPKHDVGKAFLDILNLHRHFASGHCIPSSAAHRLDALHLRTQSKIRENST